MEKQTKRATPARPPADETSTPSSGTHAIHSLNAELLRVRDAHVHYLIAKANAFLPTETDHPRPVHVAASQGTVNTLTIASSPPPARSQDKPQSETSKVSAPHDSDMRWEREVACCCLHLGAPLFLRRAICFLNEKNCCLACTKSSLGGARVCKSGNCVTLAWRPGMAGLRHRGRNWGGVATFKVLDTRGHVVHRSPDTWELREKWSL